MASLVISCLLYRMLVLVTKVIEKMCDFLWEGVDEGEGPIFFARTRSQNLWPWVVQLLGRI